MSACSRAEISDANPSQSSSTSTSIPAPVLSIARGRAVEPYVHSELGPVYRVEGRPEVDSPAKWYDAKGQLQLTEIIGGWGRPSKKSQEKESDWFASVVPVKQGNDVVLFQAFMI